MLIPNSLKVHSPHLEVEWSKKNIVPFEKVKYASNKKYWWVCKDFPNHEWEAHVNNRTGTGKNGCPYCSGKRVSELNSLKTRVPHLEKEWSSKNTVDFSSVAGGSDKKYWWTCSKFHEWEASAAHRAQGRGCPYCAGKKVSEHNSLKTKVPHLEKEWSTKNTTAFKDVSFASSKRYLWVCSKGHEWEAVTRNRTSKNQNGCPFCVQQTSKAELEIYEFIKIHWPDAQSHGNVPGNRRMSFDIYIPSLKKAVEYDGEYWHSRPGMVERDKRKNDLCMSANISLLRIPESDYVKDKQSTLTKILMFLKT